MDEPIVIRSEAPAGVSDRVRLARAARVAVLLVPGVVGTDAGLGGWCVTVVGGERLEGIVCAAASDGGYDVAVRLVAGLVALPALSARVAGAVERAGMRIGVRCSGVAVHVADVVAGGGVG